MNRCVTGVKVNKILMACVIKKKYPQSEDQIIMEGFVLKETLWIFFAESIDLAGLNFKE